MKLGSSRFLGIRRLAKRQERPFLEFFNSLSSTLAMCRLKAFKFSDPLSSSSRLRTMCKGPADSTCASAAKAAPCVVLVDPYSTGAMLAPELDQRGYALIALWTCEAGENRHHLPKAAKGFLDFAF